MSNHTISELHRIGALGLAARICNEHGTDLEAVIIEKRRHPRVTRARDQILAILRWSTSMSLTELGEMFEMDHSSVLVAIERHERFINGEDRQAAKVQLTKTLHAERRPGLASTRGHVEPVLTQRQHGIA